jgi:hypothetical protein
MWSETHFFQLKYPLMTMNDGYNEQTGLDFNASTNIYCGCYLLQLLGYLYVDIISISCDRTRLNATPALCL